MVGLFPKVLVVLSCFTGAIQGSGLFFSCGSTVQILSYPLAFLVKISYLNMSDCIIEIVLKYCLLHRTIISE